MPIQSDGEYTDVEERVQRRAAKAVEHRVSYPEIAEMLDEYRRVFGPKVRVIRIVDL